ncbi:hypothetical protein ABZW49_44520 [Nonomuraea wenchangensis]
MLKAQRSRDNEALFAAAQQGTFADLVVAIWRTYTRPEQLSRVRGFFHVVGLAAYRPEDFREFIDSLDDLTTMLAALAEREGHDTGEALTMATVAIAAIRGLLLQEVLTPGVHSENAVDVILRMLPGDAASVAAGSAAADPWPTTTNAPPSSPAAGAENPSAPSPPASKSPSASCTKP